MVELELPDFDDLENDLTNMAAALDQGSDVVNRALEAGAVPIVEAMKRNTASNPKIISGDLHGAIRAGSVKFGKKGRKLITIGVHRKDWKHNEYYPAYVEFGHGGPAPAPAHPFARPAFDAKKEEAYEIIKRALREELSRI